MDWWAWVLVIVVLGLVAVGWWRSSSRTPEVPDHHHGRQPGQEEFRSW